MSAPVPGHALAAAAAAAGDYARAGGGDAAVLARAAAAAFGVAEAFTGLRLIRRADEEALPASPAWGRLLAEPVAAITGVAGLPAGGAPFALGPDAYAVDIDADARGWVRVTAPGGATRVLVRFEAGLAETWDALPPAVAQGVAMLAAHLLLDRDGRAPPAAVAALWRPFRRLRLMEARR